MINTFSYLVFHLFQIRDAACCERILRSTVVTLRAVCVMNTAVCSLSFQRQTWAKWRNSDKTRRIPTAHLAWPSDLSLTHTPTHTHTNEHTNARTQTHTPTRTHQRAHAHIFRLLPFPFTNNSQLPEFSTGREGRR